ncbi:hypothetical protein EMPG_11426 [Blastomyces silverae]|uniref:Uncharacterized protein n=1 Tax=Blastomyces silverae TaxID=2060906 RepID=A0A0H1BQ22_9EURO|nr:hypothetical protein EMPG_11426 [Blastomyces silverae]
MAVISVTAMDLTEKADLIPSDVSLLWQQALARYRESTGKDLQKVPRFTSVENILKDAELQQTTFNRFRHDGELIDRLRSSVARNVNYLGSLRFLVDGAALAYPPTVAISSAMFHFLQVTKDVSSDYDQIVDLFDSMRSFLERLSIIEGKLPSIPAYTSHVMRVFSALLSVWKWAKAFREGGNDENLQSAKYTMKESLAQLESASLTVILATTQDLKQDTKVVVNQTERIDSRTERIEVSILAQQEEFHDMSANFKKLLKNQQKEARKMQLHDSGKAADAASRKHAAFNSVKLHFENSIDPAWQARDIEYSFVRGSARWVLDEEAYQSWREGTANPYLWISGDTGLGKTSVAFLLSKELADVFASEPKTSVAAFYFQDDQAEFTSVSNALSSIIIQIAGGNSGYCQQASSEIGKHEGVDTDDWTDLWERFFQSKFGSGSTYRLFLIIDGLDQITADDRSKFLELLARIQKQSLNIHVLLTSRVDIQSSPSFLEPLKIIITKEKLRTDMTLLVEDRLRRFQNLYTFGRRTKKKILSKILEKADSMLYVDHMLRRYNSIGREGAVLKDLETSFPDSLQSAYNILLTEVQQRRTSEHLQIFKQLLLWLAFAKRLLTVGEAEGLATLLDQDRSYSVIEEVEGKSSSILRITRSMYEENRDEESDDGENFLDGDSIASDMIADDNAATLQFLDRSLRDYFRSADVGESPLRTKPSSAHLSMFATSVDLICGRYNSAYEARGNQLNDYAINFWADHFLELDPLSATEPDLVRVIESLSLILNNHNNAAKELESGPGYREIFGKTVKRQNRFLSSVSIWVRRASTLENHRLTDGAKLWVASASQSPLKIMVPLARGHISNWFQQIQAETESFRFAPDALLMTDLCAPISAKHITDAKNIKMFADVFSDIPKDETAYRAIGLILKDYGHYDEGIVACNAALGISISGAYRFRTSVVLAQMYAQLYDDEEDDESDDEEDDVSENVPDVESNSGNAKKDPNQYNAIAYKTICEALSNRPSVDDPTTEREIRLLIREALLIRGDCEQAMDRLDEAVKSYGEARIICPSEILDGVSLNGITGILGEQSRFVELMENVEQWTFWERMAWLTGDEDDRHDMFRQAATETGKEDFLIRTYGETIAYLDRSKSSAGIRWELASFYQTIKGDFEKAKPLYYKIIDGDSFINPATGDDDLSNLSVAQLALADIIYGEFRRAETVEKKMASMDELKRLQTRRRRAAVDDGDVYETHSSIVLVNMLRKMGPAHEFRDLLEKTFETCISSLTDDRGWNDQNSLCLLAKVLASVGGLEREAQIAFSAQFYIIDPRVQHVWSSDQESDWSTDSEDGSNGSNAASDAGSGPSGSAASSAGSPTSNTGNHQDEDFAPDVDYICSGECANDSIEGWDRGPVYLCMICPNCDLCEECYQKRQALNEDPTKNNHWRLYCGAKHWYIKGPVEGWKGIKDGYMTIGEEKIKFTDWLEEIRSSKWKRAWEQFWMREETQGDILG